MGAGNKERTELTVHEIRLFTLSADQKGPLMGLMCYSQYLDGTFIAIEPKAMLAHDFQSGLTFLFFSKTKSNQPGRLTSRLVLVFWLTRVPSRLPVVFLLSALMADY